MDGEIIGLDPAGLTLCRRHGQPVGRCGPACYSQPVRRSPTGAALDRWVPGPLRRLSGFLVDYGQRSGQSEGGGDCRGLDGCAWRRRRGAFGWIGCGRGGRPFLPKVSVAVSVDTAPRSALGDWPVVLKGPVTVMASVVVTASFGKNGWRGRRRGRPCRSATGYGLEEHCSTWLSRACAAGCATPPEPQSAGCRWPPGPIRRVPPTWTRRPAWAPRQRRSACRDGVAPLLAGGFSRRRISSFSTRIWACRRLRTAGGASLSSTSWASCSRRSRFRCLILSRRSISAFSFSVKDGSPYTFTPSLLARSLNCRQVSSSITMPSSLARGHRVVLRIARQHDVRESWRQPR